MARWQPGSRERLQDAALDLFTEHGYTPTTATAIAERAGVTERTFYRYFKDKREVLFSDDERIRDLLVEALGTPRDAVLALAADMEPRRERLARRASVVEANPELAERELWKLRSWASAVTAALIERGDAELAATAQVEVAMALFRTAFARWVHGTGSPSLADTIERTYAAAGLPG